MTSSLRPRAGVAMALVVVMPALAAGLATADPIDDALEHTPFWEADDTLLDMFLTPPEGREAEALALANGLPPCVPIPALRGHISEGDQLGIQLTDCPEIPAIFGAPPNPMDLVTSAIALGGACDRPTGSGMTSSTPIWYTAYVDAEFAAHRDVVKEVSALNTYLSALFDGEVVHGIDQPHVYFCPNWIMAVPSEINNGDVDDSSHFQDVIDHEAGFPDPGQFILVFGWNKIKSSGVSVNGLNVGHVGDQAEESISYFHYWGGHQYVGFRLAFHEVGHAFDAPHSDCTSQMDNHNFIHIMAFSNDRHSTCEWSANVPHSHWIFKGPDAGTVDGTFAAWCSDRRGSAC